MAEVLQFESKKRPFTFTFVALADHKQEVMITVENEYLSLAYAAALSEATLEAGQAVVLKQDHPKYKGQK